MRALILVDNTLQDLSYSIRQLRKNPVFAATAVFVLALAASAAIAIFGFVDAALIKPLPYRDQSRLVMVFQSAPAYPRSVTSYLDFTDWKRLNNVFSSLDAYALNGSFTLATATGAEQVQGTRVSSGFFHTLGVTPLIGRDFRVAEDSPAAARTALLSYAAWQKRFGGKPDVLGRTLILNGNQTTIIGVLPRSFHFALYGGADFWSNLRVSDGCEQRRDCRNLNMIARLKDGISIDSASAQLQSIARHLQQQYPDTDRSITGATIVPLRDVIVGDIRPILLVMLSGAGLLLLIAYVNISTLLLARSDTRRREIAVRSALGASSSRLFHQFAIEGLVLAALGGFLGLAFAQTAMHFLTSILPLDKIESMPYLRGLGLNTLTLAFGGSISLLAALLFALIPIGRTFLAQMAEGLKEGARGYAGTTWRRFGSNLVVLEVAIAMVLMVGAALLGKSLYLLLHVDIGFNADHLSIIQTSWAPGQYDDDRQLIVLERQLLERISSLPGVTSAGLATAPPIDSDWGTTSFHVAGRANHGEINEVLNRQISAGYFATLQARVFRGRWFRKEEDLSKPLVVIVNRALAEKYFPGQDPVGKQIYYDWQPRSLMQIVGIIDNIKEGPLEGASLPALYVPFTQNPQAWPAVLVRSSEPQTTLIPQIIQAIHKIDPFVTVSPQGSMTERINQSPSAYLHWSSALFVGLFATTALLLSVAGLYGVIAYSVSQRTREIGVRMALGAERSTVYRLILKEAGRLTVFGIVSGLACSLAATTLLRSLLFGVRPWDVPTLIIVAALLGFSALLASYVPARRAAAVNPVEALRSE